MSRSELLELIARRSKLESEIDTLIKDLEKYNAKGFDQSLVDREGFPRENLDFGELTVYRNLKRQLNEKNNDYSALMKIIEESSHAQILQDLYAFHALLKEDPNVMASVAVYVPSAVQHYPMELEQQEAPQQQPEEEAEEEEQKAQPQIIPFVRLTEVTDGSPSAQAGFELDDMIVRFGTIHAGNHNNLAGLSQCVRDNLNRELYVTLLRRWTPLSPEEVKYNGELYAKMTLKLTPQEWAGAGVLGYVVIIIKHQTDADLSRCE